MSEVPAPKETRDPTTGRFVKGNKIRPHHNNGGRPKKLDSKAMLQAINDGFTPEEVIDLLYKSIEMAEKANDWRGVFEVGRLILAYSIGKPVQRSIKAEITPEKFAQLFKDGEVQDDEDAIDLE